ncbi:hypothetical protein BJY00DRAFT_44733 [Aspergillus carlsbadensis]|nr:hypothetical protein BJY00DRAFT_44733 [Aspergillus carlsbadensis]
MMARVGQGKSPLLYTASAEILTLLWLVLAALNSLTLSDPGIRGLVQDVSRSPVWAQVEA